MILAQCLRCGDAHKCTGKGCRHCSGECRRTKSEVKDSEILDQVVRALKIHDESIVAGGSTGVNATNDRVFIRVLRPILALRND